MSVASVIGYIDAIAPESVLLFTPVQNSIPVGSNVINLNLIDAGNKPVLSENSTYLCVLDIILSSDAVPPATPNSIKIDNATLSPTLQITLTDGTTSDNKFIAIPVMGNIATGQLNTSNNRLSFSFILNVGTLTTVSSIKINGSLQAPLPATNIIYYGGGADNLVFTKI